MEKVKISLQKKFLALNRKTSLSSWTKQMLHLLNDQSFNQRIWLKYRSTSDSDVDTLNVDYNKENKEEYNCIQTRTDQTISPSTQPADWQNYKVD